MIRVEILAPVARIVLRVISAKILSVYYTKNHLVNMALGHLIVAPSVKRTFYSN